MMNQKNQTVRNGMRCAMILKLQDAAWKCFVYKIPKSHVIKMIHNDEARLGRVNFLKMKRAIVNQNSKVYQNYQDILKVVDAELTLCKQINSIKKFENHPKNKMPKDILKSLISFVNAKQGLIAEVERDNQQGYCTLPINSQHHR